MLDIIKEILLDDAAVTATVGTDIFTNYDTPEAVIPSVLMEVYSQDTLSSSNRETDMLHYQIKVYAMQDGGGAADVLGKKVRAALDGRSGTYTDDGGTQYDLLSVTVSDYDLNTNYSGSTASIEMDVQMNVIESALPAPEPETVGQTFGIEFTGAFAGGTGIVGQDSTALAIPADTYTHIQFDPASQATTDAPYWSDPAPIAGAHIGKGLFGGAYLPDGIIDVYNHSFTWDDGGVGAITFDGMPVGGLVRVRMDFLVSTQVSNTTIEPALDWNTRDSNDDTTFQFYLTGTPIFFGAGTPGQETLVRAELSGYIASNEDANAIVRPVIKSNNAISIKPLSILTILQK
jgi:hypothetical protein